MPEGPNKSEERLQRYARQRRAQGGEVSLHPATRRLLQGEVTRQFGTQAKEERTSRALLGLWRGRFAIGGVLAAVLITAGVLFFNGPSAKRSQMDLADAKISAPEKNVALELDRFAFDTEAEKRVAAVTPPAARSEPANKPVPARSRALDSIVQNEVQLGAKLDANDFTLTQNARENGAPVNYFGDLASVLPATNGITTLSLAAAPNFGNYQSSSNLQTKLAGVASGGANFGWGVNELPASGTGVTGSVLLADNATRFYKMNTPMPQVALRNEFDEAKRLQEALDVTKAPAQPQLAYRNVADPAVLAPQSVTAPAAPAQIPANAEAAGLSESPARPGAVGQQSSFETRRIFGGAELSRADMNGNQTFFRQAIAPAEEYAGKTKQLEDLLTKKSEQSAASQVLSQFTVEQRGNSVRFRDFDGSVYDGVIDEPARAEAEKLKENTAGDKDALGIDPKRTPALQKGNVSQAGEIAPTGEYSFRASGSNVALRQVVVVNGRFTRNTNAANASFGSRGPVAAGAIVRPQDAPAPARRSMERFGGGNFPTNSNMAIEGTVQIGATNVQRFLAVPGPRE
jgi:hypothetical protein